MVSWEDSPYLTAISSARGVLAALLTALVTTALSFLFIRRQNRRVPNDPYSIDPCPNPDCVRCQKYATIQQQTIRKLPWISRGKGDSIDRVVEGVRLGRDGSKRRSHTICPHQPQLSPVYGQYPTVLLVPRLTSQPDVSAIHGDSIHAMEQSLDEILAEFHAAPKMWNQNDVPSTSTAPWKVLHLMNQGQWIHETTRLFPETTAITESLRDLMEGCVFGNVFFSRVQSGSRIAPHCGPTNVRHRLHLTVLLKPENSTPCLHVREETLVWTPRRAMVFDDSLTHSVDCDSDSKTHERVVLIVDLWHPELTTSEREAIRDLYPNRLSGH